MKCCYESRLYGFYFSKAEDFDPLVDYRMAKMKGSKEDARQEEIRDMKRQFLRGKMPETHYPSDDFVFDISMEIDQNKKYKLTIRNGNPNYQLVTPIVCTGPCYLVFNEKGFLLDIFKSESFIEKIHKEDLVPEIRDISYLTNIVYEFYPYRKNLSINEIQGLVDFLKETYSEVYVTTTYENRFKSNVLDIRLVDSEKTEYQYQLNWNAGIVRREYGCAFIKGNEFYRFYTHVNETADNKDE